MTIERVVADELGFIFSQNQVVSRNGTDRSVWVGLSAGVDSTTLLHAAAQYCSLFNKKLSAIHVHHGLSENADDWARQAEVLCELLSNKFSISIDCIVEKVQLSQYSDGVEQAARSARYAVFAKYCRPWDILLQGHHLDDQIETFFMRAIRGSGLTGLSSIPHKRLLSRKNDCQILRPFISIEKNQLIEYANENELNWVEDESNLDSKLDRNWWRNELLPKIWQRYPTQKKSILRTINNVKHEQSLLQKLIIDRLVQNTGESQDTLMIHPVLKGIPSFNLLLIDGLNKAESLSYLRAWLAQYVDILPSSAQMQAIYKDMIQAKEDSEPQVNWCASYLHRYQMCLYLLNESIIDTSSHTDKVIDWQGKNLSGFGGQLACSEKVGDYLLMPASYNIRCWQPGDVAKPSGRSTRKMKKWWQDYKVPSWARTNWPIIVNKKTGEIAAVPGLFVCQGYSTINQQTGWQVNYCINSEE